MRTLVRRVLLLALVLTPPAWAEAPSATVAAHPPGAAVASGHRLATDAGLQILREGGNAFDAAVAVSSTLAVVEPISSGLGGGGFFLLHDARTGKDVMLDAREVAPESATADKFLDAKGALDRDRSVNGPWSAGIPGLPAALVELATQHGKLPLQQSLAPAIRIARNGFPVYRRMAQGYQSRREVMERYPGTREVYLRNGKPIAGGDLFKQPELANTLQLLGAKGFDGFYRGATANKLLAGVRQAGGHWTAEELAGYTVKQRTPIRFDYKGWTITTAPPPSSGGIALASMLQILEGYDLKAMDPVHRTHLVVEAMRRAYRDRTFFLGDPDFTAVPQRVLLSKDYAVGLRSTINPEKATPSDLLSGQPTPLEDDETTHFSIIDGEGNRVGATQTVNLLFGSGLIPKGTGVLLNDEMDDFALKPGTPNVFGVMGYAANAPKPGKRPLSSMTPTFMENADKTIVLGTPGGSRIITMVLLGILGYDDGLSAQQVAALPRYHHQWLPDVIEAETGTFDAATVQGLQDLGHALKLPGDSAEGGRGSSHVWGNLQTVEWDKRNNVLSGGSDPRNEVGKAEVQLAAPLR
ncbi:gamma-glutamyltransferase [Xanthomonas translucens]|uniref:Glutathione hydrolase proenzyme n=4 Tax=Xanthomonas campestris pv. translucens TaxID=343 RepID=A0A109HE45_XANCT|nr:gamma-glutamyltransferase [Xanthomonas translucens]KWV10485.1 gamma-glutamyltransferase [Xanthomonas translucens]MCC8444945.1 gamma-glutamyltransferase [Xanthomonas translucens pv. translucens]MCT8285909.1 gamma-glutamyltransferase [Xanthomonas translucens pv. translucens]MCT8303567.1 gamma-glutamyltransferase [Xanthomonas translucens pv. translucens]QSQ28830.1 gamma-glutamyltransferase [Xanthomonas translucens pv. translucens]